MPYEVTATRRRPQAFEALAGQEFVAETLKNSIQSNKIAHAYLFSGPRGCGKTSTARILAKALNCENGPTATPCGKCQHCLEITKGQSTDVIEIDGASNTSVNDIRQIKDEVLFPPQSSRYKIYIIDEVHMLSTSAFNALLKTIEEPPHYCIFIFATTELHKVPATIKSRCQQFNFRLVPIDKVKEQLAEAAKDIGIQADDEALYWVARESTGSMRDAYTLFDQVAAFSGDHLTYEKIRDKLGLVGVERLNAIFEDAAQNKAPEALLKIDEFLQNGISIEQFISNCTDYLRSLLLIRSGVTKEALLGHPRERYSEIVLKTWNPIQLERALSILLQLFRDIRYSISPRYELELAFSRLSWLSQYVSPAEVKRAIDEAKNLLLNGAGARQVSSTNSSSRSVSGTEGAANASVTSVSAASQTSVPKNIFAAAGSTPQSLNKAEVSSNANSTTGTAPASSSSATQTIGNTTFPKNIFAVGNSAPVTAGSAPQSLSRTEVPANASNASASANNANSTASPRPIPSFSALANVQGTNPADFNEPANGADISQSVPPDLDESFAPPDPAPSFSEGGAEPPEQTGTASSENEPQDFRSRVLKDLSMHEPMLASSLYQTGEWIKNGGAVTTTVQSTYLKMQLDQHLRKLNEYLTKFCGEPVVFRVNLLMQHRVNVADNAPESIKMLCSVFKGQIVGHSKKTEQEMAESANQQSELELAASANASDSEAEDKAPETEEDSEQYDE